MFWQKRLDSYVAMVASIVIVFIGATLYIGWDNQRIQTDHSAVVNQELRYRDFGYFTSVDDFKSFIQESDSVGTRNSTNVQTLDIASPTLDPVVVGEVEKTFDAATGSYSQTNVQVAGVDEPDIVKTNGREIFVSSENQYLKMIEPAIMEDNQSSAGSAPDSIGSSLPFVPTAVKPTQIITALPADKTAVAATIASNGQLLHAQNTLVVFTDDQKVTGYDVTDPARPEQRWTYDIDGSYLTVRLWQDKIYLIVNNTIDRDAPCPIQPLASETETVTIACDRVFHPAANTTVDSTYSVVRLDPVTGAAEQSLSFVGAPGATTVYVSTNAVYLAYPIVADYAAYSFASIIDSALDILPASIQSKITKLNEYDISIEAKNTELQSILSDYYATLSTERQASQQAEIEQRVDTYFQQHRRELAQTGLTKVALADLSVTATGTVPGYLLNQFSLDEYQGNLRLATTSSGGWSRLGLSDSTNDIYVLNDRLDTISQLQDLGLGETIYSARFVGDRGYLVTFRQTDPFYVLDMSDPRRPELKGELKIPGFSSYLHPLTDTLVLGVGSDGAQVKLSLFDVTDATKPVELATQKLDDYWSEAQNNHHAFLQDSAHKVFFLPGGQNGYVYSYDNNTLSLAKKVEGLSMTRAVYIDNHLYVIGESGLAVLDETAWNQIGTLQFTTN